jgi:hypothetical protein
MTRVYEESKRLGINFKNRTQLAVFWFLAEDAINKQTRFLEIRELLIGLLHAKCEEEGIIIDK